MMKKPINVLIVDDKKIVRQTIKNVLLEFDCIFSDAETGDEALELIKNNQFDVIFLDLKITDESYGIDVLRKAKQINHNLGKVIILTGYPDESSRSEARQSGVFSYLSKEEYKKIPEVFAKAIEL